MAFWPWDLEAALMQLRPGASSFLYLVCCEPQISESSHRHIFIEAYSLFL